MVKKVQSGMKRNTIHFYFDLIDFRRINKYIGLNKHFVYAIEHNREEINS